MSDLQQRLRRAADTLRRTSMPLADLIPLLQQAADALEAQPAQAGALLTDDEIDAIGHDAWVGYPSYDSEFKHIYRRLEQALRSKLGAGAGWQPIETAPRDGTNILLRFGQDGVSQGKYVPGAVVHPWKFIDTDDGITWLVNHAVDGPGGPSHWQPLPPPGIVGKEGA